MELTDEQIWKVVEKMGKPAEGEEYCDFYNQLKKMGALLHPDIDTNALARIPPALSLTPRLIALVEIQLTLTESSDTH